MRKTGPLRVIIDVKGMAEVDEEDLKQQIVVLQEHFLFNTLNAIKGAAILEKVLLPELLDGFADCLRYQFQCFRVNKTVSFREERKFMRTYLSMENYRFQGMTVLWDVGDCDLKVPPMGWHYMRRVLSMSVCRPEDVKLKFLVGFVKISIFLPFATRMRSYPKRKRTKVS